MGTVLKILLVWFMASFAFAATWVAIGQSNARKKAERRRMCNIRVVQEPQEPAVSTCDFEE